MNYFVQVPFCMTQSLKLQDYHEQTITTLNYLLICLHEVAHEKSCKKLFSEKKTNFFDFFLIISATWYFQKQITLLADDLTSKQRVKDSVGK